MSDKYAHDDDFDGIKEEDNPMPDWWLWTFLLTIPFAFIYFIHFHMTEGHGIQEEYQAEKARVEALIATHGPDINELANQVRSGVSDDSVLASGEAIFQQQCAVCHGKQGEGLIGANLTDRHFIHGADAEDTLKVIKDGVSAKGMPAWGQVLSQQEMVQVAAYVQSLAGEMIEGKPPEGQEVSD